VPIADVQQVSPVVRAASARDAARSPSLRTQTDRARRRRRPTPAAATAEATRRYPSPSRALHGAEERPSGLVVPGPGRIVRSTSGRTSGSRSPWRPRAAPGPSPSPVAALHQAAPAETVRMSLVVRAGHLIRFRQRARGPPS
jgi:hypothetical protein